MVRRLVIRGGKNRRKYRLGWQQAHWCICTKVILVTWFPLDQSLNDCRWWRETISARSTWSLEIDSHGHRNYEITYCKCQMIHMSKVRGQFRDCVRNGRMIDIQDQGSRIGYIHPYDRQSKLSASFFLRRPLCLIVFSTLSNKFS